MTRRGSETGLVSALVVALLALVALMSLATADAANVLMVRARAQTAADAAALAAAAARLITDEHREPELVAESVAQANGATLEDCDCSGDEVTVVVSMPTRTRMLGVAPSRVQAEATAELDLAKLFQSPDRPPE